MSTITQTHSIVFPRLKGVIIFRLIISAVFILPFVAVFVSTHGTLYTDSASAPMIVATEAMALIIGLPSLAVSIGLFLHKRWMAWVGVVLDFIAVTVLFLGGPLLLILAEILLPPYHGPKPIIDDFLAMILVYLPLVAFIVEAVHLLRQLRK